MRGVPRLDESFHSALNFVAQLCRTIRSGCQVLVRAVHGILGANEGSSVWLIGCFAFVGSGMPIQDWLAVIACPFVGGRDGLQVADRRHVSGIYDLFP